MKTPIRVCPAWDLGESGEMKITCKSEHATVITTGFSIHRLMDEKKKKKKTNVLGSHEIIVRRSDRVFWGLVMVSRVEKVFL